MHTNVKWHSFKLHPNASKLQSSGLEICHRIFQKSFSATEKSSCFLDGFEQISIPETFDLGSVLSSSDDRS